MDVKNHKLYLAVLFWIHFILDLHSVETRRAEHKKALTYRNAIEKYRYCSEGCCPEEFCAFHLICYPKTHCVYGCPDGACIQHTCMPTKPCKQNLECKVGNVCSMDYNLGYKTCQYNLNIGKTLCVDRDGNSLLKPET